MFLEYAGPDGEMWRAEAGDALLEAFGIGDAASMERWHSTMTDGSGSNGMETFLVLRQIYALHPMFGVDDPGQMRAWSLKEIATARWQELWKIERLMKYAIAKWVRASGAFASEKQAAPMAGEAAAEVPVKRILGLPSYVEWQPFLLLVRKLKACLDEIVMGIGRGPAYEKWERELEALIEEGKEQRIFDPRGRRGWDGSVSEGASELETYD